MKRFVAWGAACASLMAIPAVAKQVGAQRPRGAAPRAEQAASGARDVRYAPAPDWVIAPPAASTAPAPPGAPMRVVYMDEQVRLVPKRTTRIA